MSWETIVSIVSVFGVLFMVFIEWPRFQERLRRSTGEHETIRGLLILGVVLAMIGVGVGSQLGSDSLTNISMGIFICLLGTLVLYASFYAKPHEANREGVRGVEWVYIILWGVFIITGILLTLGTLLQE